MSAQVSDRIGIANGPTLKKVSLIATLCTEINQLAPGTLSNPCLGKTSIFGFRQSKNDPSSVAFDATVPTGIGL
jgi:hypothetical protein